MIGGYRILEHSCSRCGIRRTAELDTSHVTVCFDCRLQRHHRSDDGRYQLVHEDGEPAANALTVSEWVRWNAYRGAVLAGVYSDWPVGTIGMRKMPHRAFVQDGQGIAPRRSI